MKRDFFVDLSHPQVKAAVVLVRKRSIFNSGLCLLLLFFRGQCVGLGIMLAV